MMKVHNMAFALLTVAALGLSACGGSGNSGIATPGNSDQPIQNIGTLATPSEVPATAQNTPAKPAGVAATSGANRVTITWNPVSGATSYNIYWSNDPAHVMKEHGAKQISNVSSPYHHTALTAAATYAYAVTAVNSAGESGESAVAAATTAATDSPGVALYATYCASCHNPLAISNKKGRSAAQTQSAIADNRGGMGNLSTLTPAQLQAIADVLGY